MTTTTTKTPSKLDTLEKLLRRKNGASIAEMVKATGWQHHSVRYDDGGFSGGTMERPGLARLLADIEANRVDIVVVYKIDRLARSLADFARIVEIFEAADCSFVSVTQSFNTTGSMGKLMLNVLLSFAQFEREVTGERIRDKIAASKAKGMWMGGTLPLGYDRPADDSRILQVNADEADTVRQIFGRYLDLGSVHALQRELDAHGIRSKQWTTSKGRPMGGQPFSRGALFHLLRNRLYLGKIVHKGEVHEGGHAAIVEEDLFERVQRHLDANARRHRAKGVNRCARAPLTGKLFDAVGEPMSPTTSRGKSGKCYRYYVSASLQKGAGKAGPDAVQRLSANDIERVVGEAIGRWVPGSKDPYTVLDSVSLSGRGLQICVRVARQTSLIGRLGDGETIVDRDGDRITILVPVALPRRGGRRLVLPAQSKQSDPDPILIAALRKAHAMLARDRGMPVIETAPVSPNERMILRLAFLAPDIQRAIIDGRQPRHFNLEYFKSVDLPLAWSKQRERLGFGEPKRPCSVD